MRRFQPCRKRWRIWLLKQVRLLKRESRFDYAEERCS